MKLIDRYVYAVTEHLEANTREDVSSELRGNIEDMLPENFSENDVREVLLKLGNPRDLADGYSERKRYLIGPGLYDNYISVLKLVICIVTTVFISLTIVEWCFNPPIYKEFAQMSIKFFLDLLLAPVQGVFQGFLWVTFIFAIIERTGINEGKIPFLKKKWSPEDLEELPVSKRRRISRIETVFSLFCSVFFTALIYWEYQLIGLYVKGSNGLIFVAPLFVSERLQSYIVVILLFTIIQVSILIWKFISMKWNVLLAIANATLNISLSVFVCVMLSDNFLFNKEFLSKIADYTNITHTQILSYWTWNLWIFATVFIFINLLDSIMGFVKCKK